MKKARIIMAMAVLLGVASLAEAQIVVSSTTASTHRERPRSGREKGWVIRPEIKSGWGLRYGPLLVGINGVIAYQINSYFAFGGGLGYDYDIKYGQTNASWMPVFINARTYFCDRKWSPFFDIKTGVNFPITKGVYSNSSETEKASGFTLGGTIGVQYKNFDFGIAACYLNYFQTRDIYFNGELIRQEESKEGQVSITINLGYNLPLKK